MNTKEIKFYWNGIKVNSGKLIRCFYSMDNSTTVKEPCVSISARDYADLPGDVFAVTNETDIYTDYFDSDRATITAAHPLYKFARHAAEKSEMHDLNRSIEYDAQKAASGYNREYYTKELERMRAKLAELQTHKDPGQPTPADLAAVEAMNNAAETARIEAEHAANLARREKIMNQRNDGRRYIDTVCTVHPVKEGAPVVVIPFSESPYLYSYTDGDGLKMSVAAAEIVLKHFDEVRVAENAEDDCGGYDKTDFRIEYTDESGEASSYEGRYDLGDNDGGLIAHIRNFGTWTAEHDAFGHEPNEDTKKQGADIKALADMLEQYTDGGRVVSVTVAPWFEQAMKKRQEKAHDDFNALIELADSLPADTLEQLTRDAMGRGGNGSREAAIFFVHSLMKQDAARAVRLAKELQIYNGGKTA